MPQEMVNKSRIYYSHQIIRSENKNCNKFYVSFLVKNMLGHICINKKSPAVGSSKIAASKQPKKKLEHSAQNLDELFEIFLLERTTRTLYNQ